MKQEKSQIVHVGDLEVIVTWKRVKNVNFRIGSDGKARMSVPLYISYKQAENLIRDHASWFESRLAKRGRQQLEPPLTWTTGELLYVWGTPTPLHVLPRHDCPSPCALNHGELIIRDEGNAQRRAAAVETWLQQQLFERISEILPACEQAVGRQATHITIRRMKTRWGSCTTSTGRIRMNTALAECPPACTQTVLTHELCHLRIRNHGPQFKSLMDLCDPGWRAAQRWLDEHPPSVRDFSA